MVSTLPNRALSAQDRGQAVGPLHQVPLKSGLGVHKVREMGGGRGADRRLGRVPGGLTNNPVDPGGPEVSRWAREGQSGGLHTSQLDPKADSSDPRTFSQSHTPKSSPKCGGLHLSSSERTWRLPFPFFHISRKLEDRKSLFHNFLHV